MELKTRLFSFFISDILSDQATMKYHGTGVVCFRFCVKQLTPYLMSKHFTVKTDRKNLVYLANSSIPKLCRQRVVFLEFRLLIQHIPCAQNFVADGLTRVMSLSCVEILKSEHHTFIEDSQFSVIRGMTDRSRNPRRDRRKGRGGSSRVKTLDKSKTWYLCKIPQLYRLASWRGTHFEGPICGRSRLGQHASRHHLNDF